MSNAVSTSLPTATTTSKPENPSTFVSKDLLTSNKSTDQLLKNIKAEQTTNLDINNNQVNGCNKNNIKLASSLLTDTPPSSSSSTSSNSDSVSSAMSVANSTNPTPASKAVTINGVINTNSTNSTANPNGASKLPISAVTAAAFQPSSHHHVQHLNLFHNHHNHFNNHQAVNGVTVNGGVGGGGGGGSGGGGGGGIQYFQYSNSVNASPISSLTSSPSTSNTSTSTAIAYHPHHFNHHPITISPTSLIHHHPHSHPHHPQQFQQIQQFHHPHPFHAPNYKDTRWLTLEVCREHQRNKCNRNENECKFAHPPPHVEILNGKVIACYDSLKGKCTRKEPPCKYLHPPQHLKDQLLQNGKNNLVLRQVALAMMQQQQTSPSSTTAAAATTAALLAAAVAAGSSTPPNQQFTLANAANGSVATTNATSNGANQTANGGQAGTPQLISTTATLNNGGLTTYSPVQLTTNGQPTLLPIIAAPNGYHHPHHGQQQQFNMQHPHHPHQAAIYATTDAATAALLAVSPGASSHSSASNTTNPNGLLPPQQRTDRLQICADFQSGTCKKTAQECAHAHPPANCPIDNENSLVIVCVDFIKGKCNRETCKYFHPPEHLVSQLKKQKQTNNALAAAANAAALNTLGLLPANAAASPFATHSASQFNASFLNPFQLNTNINSNFATSHNRHQYNSANSLNNNHFHYQQRQYNHNSTNKASAITYYASKHNKMNATNNSPYQILNNVTTPQLSSTLTNANLQLALQAHQQQQQLNDLSNANALLNSRNSLNVASSNAAYSIYGISNGGVVNSNAALTTNPATTSTTSTTQQQIANYNAQIAAALANAAAGANLQGNDLNDPQAQAGATTFTLENGQTYQIPQFQIYTPIYSRAPATTATNGANQSNIMLNQVNGSSNDEGNQQQNDLNKANTASATAVNSSAAAAVATASVVDVVQGKKRQHDAIDQEFIPMSATNLYQASTLPVKRTALTDSKTGMPVFQSFANHHPSHLHQLHAQQAQHLTLAQHPAATMAAALNYPAINLAMPYATYPATFSLPYTGHQTGVPRI